MGPQGPVGPGGLAGIAGADAQATSKVVFVLHRIAGETGKTVSGQCGSGEQIIAATCSTGATIADDDKAYCPASADPGSAVPLTVTCAKP